jgi:glycosyltransferase involved in cell wall biosynthesis
MPKISVLMPVYNGERFLREAVESVLAQTYPDWELLVLDDGSTDASAAIAASFTDPRIRVICNDRNRGLVETLNRGLSEANGDLIARLDADDAALRSRFELQVAEFENKPELMLLGGQAELFGAASGLKLVPQSASDVNATIPFENPFIHSAVMFRARYPDGTSVAYDANYPHAEDYALWSMMIWKGGYAFNLEMPVVRYRIHSQSVSHLHREQQAVTALRIRFAHFRHMGIAFTEIEENHLIEIYTDKSVALKEKWLKEFTQQLLPRMPGHHKAQMNFAVFIYGLWPAADSNLNRARILVQLLKVNPNIALWLVKSKVHRLVERKWKNSKFSF